MWSLQEYVMNQQVQNLIEICNFFIDFQSQLLKPEDFCMEACGTFHLSMGFCEAVTNISINPWTTGYFVFKM